MPIPRLGRLGILLVFIGLAGFPIAKHWLDTRTLIALDISVSLSPGHFSTPEFSINTASGYYVVVAVERTSSDECLILSCYQKPSTLKLHWTASNAGTIFASGSSDEIDGAVESIGGGFLGRDVGHFNAGTGRYRIDLDVAPEAASLNQGRPRLWVRADGNGFNRVSRLYEESKLISAALMVLGVLLWIRSRAVQRAGKSISLEISPGFGISTKPPTPIANVWPKSIFSGLPAFGVTATVAVVAVLIPAWFLTAWKISPRGILVLTSKRALPFVANDPENEPLVLRVDKDSRWYVNEERFPAEKIEFALKERLARRPNWVVYLDADPSLNFEVPVRAMDMIQGLHAKIVLLTPSARSEVTSHRHGRLD